MRVFKGRDMYPALFVFRQDNSKQIFGLGTDGSDMLLHG